MKIRVWKPGEKGNPCTGHYYCQFFLRKKRYRGVLEARNFEQAKQPHRRFGTMSGTGNMILSHLHLNKFCLATL
jgi:hypothetical protein